MAGVREAWMPVPIRPTSTERGAAGRFSPAARMTSSAFLAPLPDSGRGARRPQALVLRLVHRRGTEVAEVVEMDAVGLPGTERRERRDDRHAEGERADLERDVHRAGRGDGGEQGRQQGSDGRADV